MNDALQQKLFADFPIYFGIGLNPACSAVLNAEMVAAI